MPSDPAAHRRIRARAPKELPDLRPRYVSQAPLLEILTEQLEYLVTHASSGCPPNCSECLRLSQTANWLLLPFTGSPPGNDCEVLSTAEVVSPGTGTSPG